MEVKIFRINGIITSPNYKTAFSKEVRALRMEDAIERVYAEFGGQHRVKRTHVKITSVNEISLEETKDTIIHELSGK